MKEAPQRSGEGPVGVGFVGAGNVLPAYLQGWASRFAPLTDLRLAEVGPAHRVYDRTRPADEQ